MFAAPSYPRPISNEISKLFSFNNRNIVSVKFSPVTFSTFVNPIKYSSTVQLSVSKYLTQNENCSDILLSVISSATTFYQVRLSPASI